MLEEKKYKIKNESETDILVGLYLVFGNEFPKFIDGHFSIAIFDGKKLFLARDRLGVKPLFYYFNKNIFLFGSEIKAVIQGIREEIKIDVESLYERFVFADHLVSNSTYFKNIKQLLPGSYCLVSRNKGLLDVVIKDYGDIDRDITGLREEDLEKIIMENVERNVRYYVEQTGSTGILLSGGFDSSVLAGIASKYSRKTLKTFTISDNQDFPDIKAARLVAKHLGTEHHEFIIDSTENETDLIQGIRAYEDLTFRDTIFKLGKKINGMVNIAIAGTGADLLSKPLLFRKSHLYPGSNLHSVRIKYARLARLLAYKGGNHRISRYMEDFLSSLGKDAKKAVHKHFINSYFPNQLFPSIERALMYFGVEAAFPFADKNILFLSSHVPYNMKNDKNEEKPLLRKTFSYLNLPESIKTREKLCSKNNLKKSKNELRKLAYNLSNMHIIKHDFMGFLFTKYTLMCFEIIKNIFIDNKGIVAKDFSIANLYKKYKSEY